MIFPPLGYIGPQMGLPFLSMGAALMALPRSRKFGGMWSAGLLVGVFPANVSMALRSGRRSRREQIIAWARLPFQIPMIRWAWQSGR